MPKRAATRTRESAAGGQKRGPAARPAGLRWLWQAPFHRPWLQRVVPKREPGVHRPPLCAGADVNVRRVPHIKHFPAAPPAPGSFAQSSTYPRSLRNTMQARALGCRAPPAASKVRASPTTLVAALRGGLGSGVAFESGQGAATAGSRTDATRPRGVAVRYHRARLPAPYFPARGLHTAPPPADAAGPHCCSPRPPPCRPWHRPPPAGSAGGGRQRRRRRRRYRWRAPKL